MKEKNKKSKSKLRFLQILSAVIFICSILGLYVLYIYPGFEYLDPGLYKYYNDKTNYTEFTCKIIFTSENNAYLEIISESIITKSNKPQKATLISDNKQIAFDNGMLTELSNGDELQVLSTYIDCSPHDSIFFIAEIRKDDIIYLDFDTGYKNVTADLDKKGTALKISFSICISFCMLSGLTFLVVFFKRKKSRN